jgi:hypothetical protein
VIVPDPGAEESRPALPAAPAGNNLLTIAPEQASVPVNSETFFSLRVQAEPSLASLSISGAVSGGDCEITEVRTDTLSEKDVKVLKNISGNSFDIGLSFSANSGQVLATSFIQLKIKFTRPGKYILNVGNINAYDAKRNRVEIAPASCPIDVI